MEDTVDAAKSEENFYHMPDAVCLSLRQVDPDDILRMFVRYSV